MMLTGAGNVTLISMKFLFLFVDENMLWVLVMSASRDTANEYPQKYTYIILSRNKKNINYMLLVEKKNRDTPEYYQPLNP